MNSLLDSYNLNTTVLKDQEMLINNSFAAKDHFKVQENINRMKFAGLAIMVLESDIIKEEDKKMIVKLLILGEYDLGMKIIEKYVG
jgi:hypothetical protein